MEYSGLIQKYKVNRPLSEEERKDQLKQKQKLDVEPHYLFAVIKSNSSYLELADKYYGWRGWLSSGTLIVIAICIGAIAMFAISLVFSWDRVHSKNPAGAIGVFVFMFAVLLGLILFGTWALRKESFFLTHFPARLNRKTRTIHLFRPDRSGTILTVPWDDVHFNLAPGQTLGYWDIRGHLLDSDRATVKESFSLGTPWGEKEALKQHWEFIRRYMENGPQQLLPLIPMYLPIANTKERAAFGLQRLLLLFPSSIAARTLLLPIFLFCAAGRIFANATSKIPEWPADIEASCQIEPGDPFERDERQNKPNRLGWLS